MLLKKINLILILTFFCNNIFAANKDGVPISEELQSLMSIAQEPTDQSAKIKEFIHECESPVALCHELTQKCRLFKVPNEKNREALAQEYSIVSEEHKEYKKKYPKESRAIQARFPDGMFVMLKPIF